MKKTLCFVYITIISVSQSFSQSFLNLDFEYSVYKDQPRKWSIEGEGDYYDAKVESTDDAHHGKKSLFLELKNAEAYVFISLPQSTIKGKTVSVSGYIKSEKYDSLQILLAFRDPQGGKPIVSPLKEPRNNEWLLITNQTSIPSDYKSDRLLVALIIVGNGKVNFDNVSIKLDGVEIGSGPPDFKEPSEGEILALNNNAIPIKSLEKTSSLTDLEKLDDVVANSRIVALGENSHGSAPIYKLKLRLLEYLVQRKGFSVFALESPTVEADIINDYVTKNTGTLSEVLTNLVYPSWKTQEMLDIIEWIKKYNQNANVKVQFRGFDMQDEKEALNRLTKFALNNDENLRSKLSALNLEYTSSENPKEWKPIYEQAEKITSYLNHKSKADYPNATQEEFLNIKMYAIILTQSIGLKLRLKSRDEYMAENIQWLLENTGDDAHIIVSGDNSHITKATGKMGQFLQAKYADDYLAFGFSFNQGTYSAYGDKKYYEVHPSYVGTYEYFFAKSKFDNYFLDLRPTKIKTIVSSSNGFRSIGSRPQETTQFAEIILTGHFDVVAYIENSAPTTMK